MGYGSYTAADWTKLKTSRKIESSTTEQLFIVREMDPKYDPKYIDKREARDSAEHPRSTPIMIGVDVTGSMGYLSTQIVKESLNELMQKLYSSKLIEDPQLLFAAIGDAYVDRAPLQVTQFESDIRIAEQLLNLWLEGNGGDAPEDYELLWYFADKHTDTDCYRVRGEKGFCFTIGDADFHSMLDVNAIKKIFGDAVPRDISSAELADRAAKKYELFHIHIGSAVCNASNYIPGRVLHVEKSQINYLPEIIISAMQLVKGVPMKKVLGQWGELARSVVQNSLALLTVARDDRIIF